MVILRTKGQNFLNTKNLLQPLFYFRTTNIYSGLFSSAWTWDSGDTSSLNFADILVSELFLFLRKI